MRGVCHSHTHCNDRANDQNQGFHICHTESLWSWNMEGQIQVLVREDENGVFL